MLPGFCAEEVTVERAPLSPSRGASVRDWARASAHTVRGCSVQPASTSTDREGRAAHAASDAVLYAPPAADVAAGDRVTDSAGRAWLVDGEPMAWASPTGAVSHVQCNLRRWVG